MVSRVEVVVESVAVEIVGGPGESCFAWDLRRRLRWSCSANAFG